MVMFEARATSVLYNLLLSRGDDRPFLLPANVCPIVPIAFLKARRRFEFIDICRNDFVMDRDRCLELLRRDPGGYGGILFVRAYGADGDEAHFFQTLKEVSPDLLLIDDKCLCRPDSDGRRLEPCADVSLFSTGYAKHVDLGLGGFAHLGAHVPYRRQSGRYRPAALEEITRRYKTAAAEGLPFQGGAEDWLELSRPALEWKAYREKVLKGLKSSNEIKCRLGALYAQRLPDEVQLPPRFQTWRFNIVVPRPARLLQSLFGEGLFAGRHFASLGGVFCEDRFPQAERLQSGIVNLFNDRYYDDEKAERTADAVLRHLSAL